MIKIDAFGRNIILVFLGTSLVSFFNLLYQLLIAHRLSPPDFAAFNTLLSILMVMATPLFALQTAVAKYSAEFCAQKQIEKVRFLLTGLLRRISLLAVLTFIIFYSASFYILDKLKISSPSSGYILAVLLAFAWIIPVFFGAIQGLELFHWLMFVSVATGALKLILAFIFLTLGYNISGALGAFLASSLIAILIAYLPLKSFFSLKAGRGSIDFKEIYIYMFPVAISSFCFMNLVNFDMILVKYFFTPQESGLYSLAQMLGKIFLFLPAAISMVMFPRTSGLHARNMDTAATLKRSLLYAGILCIGAGLIYNVFPAAVLRILTGKAFPESIVLGRLFSVSMSFFTLLFILISYFLSKNDLRFIKYLVLSAVLQALAIILFHKSLIQVQAILCLNSIMIFVIHLFLSKGTVCATTCKT